MLARDFSMTLTKVISSLRSKRLPEEFWSYLLIVNKADNLVSKCQDITGLHLTNLWVYTQDSHTLRPQSWFIISLTFYLKMSVYVKENVSVYTILQ